MKKKKLLVPLAIMSLTCGLAVGVLTGCGEKEHVHDYTKWDHDESGHWQICTEDNEKSEKKPHVYGADDKCECGAEKPALSTASGQVKLLKLGQFVEDYTGVTVDTGDDDGNEVDYNAQTGAFSITDLQVGKSYTLSISKAGYLTYNTTLEVVEGENSVVGGTKGCILQYDAFSHGKHVGNDWTGNYGTPSKIDKSHVNDAENPYFTIGAGTGDFYVYSNDTYETVTASVLYKDSLTWGVNDDERGNQGIRLVFEDGKAAMIRIEKLSNGKFKAQWFGGTDFDWEEQAILKDWDFGNDEAHYNPFSAEVEEKYKETGIELKLIRNGSAVYAYVNGEKMGEQMLPAQYATQKCRVALAAGHVNGGQKIPFAISDSIPEAEFASALTLEKGTLPQGVEVSLDKTEGYKRGDLVTLSVDLTDKTAITALSYNGGSVLNQYADGKVSVVLTGTANALSVTVAEKQYVNLTDVSVTGKKYDVRGTSLKDGAVITLQGQGGLADIELTLAGGKVSKQNVAQGTYTAVLQGYKPATVVIGADGIQNGITLEYDGFGMLPPNYDEEITDFSQINEGIIKVNGNGGQSLDIVTKDAFTDVAVTINIKDSVAGVVQGIVLKFEDGKFVLLNFKKDQTLIQYRPDCWGMESVFGKDNWIEYAITSADIDAFNSDDGIALALVRKGGMLYAFLGDRCISADALPEGYGTMKAQVGFFAWNVKANASWNYIITQELPDLSGTAELTKDFPAGVEGITASLDKTEYTLGDKLTLSVTLPRGYLISELTVNGVSYLNGFKDGKVTFMASANEIEVAVKVVEGQYANIQANVTGKKYDVTGSSIADGTTVTLVGKGGIGTVKLTVTDGKITKQNVIQGTYTVEVEGYKPTEITVGANGIEGAITLEYDGFESLYWGWDWDRVVLDKANEGEFRFNGEHGKTFSVKTKDKFVDVAAMLVFKKTNSTNGIYLQGIDFEFGDGKVVMLGINLNEGKVQFRPGEWSKTSVWGDTWVEIYLTEAEKQAFQTDGGLPITLVRKDGKVYVLIQQDSKGTVRCANVTELPEDYRTQQAQVGFYAADGAAGAVFKYNITTTLPELASTVKLTKDVPAGVEGVTATVDKTACTLGDTVTLSVTLPQGYLISKLTVNGVSYLNSFKEGKVTFPASAKEIEVEVKVVAAEYTNVEVNVTGKKYDVAGNSLEGKEIALVGQGGIDTVKLTVTNGKITKQNMIKGVYSVEAEGYKPVNVTVGANGIETPIVLEYNGFDIVFWDGEMHDFTHANDENSKIGCNNKTLNVLTKDSYTDVSASLTVKDANSRNGNDVQGIWLKFDDGKYLILRSATYDNQYRLTYLTNQWGAQSWLKNEINFYFFNDADTTAIKGDGIELQLVRKGGMVYTFLGNQFVYAYELPEGYATRKAQVGFWDFDSAENAVWDFAITTTLPDLTSAVTLTKDIPEGAQGVDVTVDKTSCTLGDTVTVSMTISENYRVKDITVNGVSMLKQLSEGKITFAAMKAQNTVVVTVSERQYANIDVVVTGKKYDVSGNSIADGKTVTLKGLGGLADVTLTVTNGKITKENVEQGKYTAEAEGYKSVEVTVGANGIETPIVLEYDAFVLAMGWDGEMHDFTHVNDENSKIGCNNKTLNVLTKDSYIDVSTSIKIKDANSRHGNDGQGIWLKFDDGKYLILRSAIWDNQYRLTYLSGKMWEAQTWLDNEINFYFFNDADTTAIKGDGIELQLVRKGGKVYTFLGGNCVNAYELPEGYATRKAQVGFWDWDSVENAVWDFDITTTLPALTGTAELTKNLPEVEGISASLDKTEYALGDEITLTVTITDGYLVSELTVNGVSYLDRLNEGKLTIMASVDEIAVSVRVIAGEYANIQANVTGKKYDVAGNSLEGKEITLVGQGGIGTVKFTVTEGKIAKQNVIQGTYTVQAEGYKSVDVTVGANGIETPIVLECDSFYAAMNWGSFDFEKQNNQTPEISFTNDCCIILTKDTYDDVMTTVYLSGQGFPNGSGSQGIAFRFVGDGISDGVVVRMENKQKVQFYADNLWPGDSHINKAEGSDWQDLIFFQDGDKYLQAYDAGTLKLSVVRKGATFYVFLQTGDDAEYEFIGCRTFNAKYENMKVEAGFFSHSVGSEKKTWKFGITTTLPGFEVTNGTTDTNGTVAFSSETPKSGEKVTVTITPNSGYVLKKLTVGGQDVTGSAVGDQNTVVNYTFAATKDTEVVAEFEQATFVNVDVAISGAKGTEGVILNGTKVTLANNKAKYEITVADGKLTQTNVPTGEYTLTAEGYVSQKVTVTESGIANAILLVYNFFTSEPASADLSKLNEGKVTATGNGGVELETKDKYTNVTAEAVFDLVGDYVTQQRRYSIALKFNDGKVLRVDLDLHEGDKHIVQQAWWDTMMGFNWESVKEYSADEIAAFKNVTYKIERDGATVKISINGELIKTYTLPESYANQDAQLKFIFDSNGTDGTKGFTFDITVPDGNGEN